MFCGFVAHAQSSAHQDLFATAKPQIQVIIRRHSIGADIVTVTALDKNYPPSLLRSQVDTLCSELKAPARGLQISTVSLSPSDTKLDFLTASFGTLGLFGEDGQFEVEPIARAFAGAPRPFTVEAISVTFEGATANGNTLQAFESPAIKVQARINKLPVPSVEYTIAILKQDPNQISIGDTDTPAKRPTSVTEAPRITQTWLLWTMVAIAAVALGVLVYLALLRLPADGR